MAIALGQRRPVREVKISFSYEGKMSTSGTGPTNLVGKGAGPGAGFAEPGGRMMMMTLCIRYKAQLTVTKMAPGTPHILFL